MNLYKKKIFPENLSSLKDINYENDKIVNEFIHHLITNKNIDPIEIKQIFLKFFKNNLNEKIRDNYMNLLFTFINKILPVILDQQYPKKGIYQLLRFLSEISPNFEYIEQLISKPFIYENLSRILTYSGHVVNLLSKDKKLLETLDPYYALRLETNYSYYINHLNKIDYKKKHEEDIYNNFRSSHRYLKFQIIISVIMNIIDSSRASKEFYLLAKASLQKAIEISFELVSQKQNVKNISPDEISILTYGRFSEMSMTANSDLDLTFVFPDNLAYGYNQKKIFETVAKKIINLLSAKTSQGMIYEIDTVLNPGNSKGSVACQMSDFTKFHKFNPLSWQKLALLKSSLFSSETIFEKKVEKVLKILKLKDVNINKLILEIKKMRFLDPKEQINLSKTEYSKKVLVNWYETKYSIGGQRDIEFLEFLYKKPKINSVVENIEEKKFILKKIKHFYLVLDQYINITFASEKPDNLPDSVINQILYEVKIRDLGSLKLKVKEYKNRIYRLLSEVLDIHSKNRSV